MIELAVALFIVALLSGFAVPTYREHIARSHRLAAVEALYAMSLAAEFASPGVASPRAVGDRLVPPHGVPVYRITLQTNTHHTSSPTKDGYVVLAQPTLQGPQAKDACGTFVLDSSGERFNQRASGDLIPHAQSCWQGGHAPQGSAQVTAEGTA